LLAIKKPITDIDRAFNQFKLAEAQSWRDSGLQTPPPLEFLVKPSGSFHSLISHRANQPSFTTNVPANGETADRTNGCISMIMGTAYDNTTLMYDQVHRRDPESHGSTSYPQHVRQAHKEWTRQISESSEAKVEVVYGGKATRAIMTDPEVKMTPLPLWGEYSGMILFLIHEECPRQIQIPQNHGVCISPSETVRGPGRWPICLLSRTGNYRSSCHGEGSSHPKLLQKEALATGTASVHGATFGGDPSEISISSSSHRVLQASSQ
jgi:hypothetical protein